MMSKANVQVRSDGGKVRRVAVVGGGVAGLMTALELVGAGVPVEILSTLPARRAPSAGSQAGLNAVVDPYGQGDSFEAHVEDTLARGEYLAHQPPVRAMVEAAPGLVELFDRMGVPFNRTGEGRPAARRLPGSSFARAVFSGATTGSQILSALDDQIRRFEGELTTDDRGGSLQGEPLVRRLEGFDFVRLVLDDSGVCIGIVAQDLRTMTIKAMPYDAVVLATGGFASIFGGSSAGVASNGAAIAAAMAQGAAFANAEFVQIHPTAIHGSGPPRLISEAARSDGARLWVPKDPKDARAPRDISERERDYFLERLYPEWGNRAAPDVAARAIARLCIQDGAGVWSAKASSNERSVYLDLSHERPALVRERLGNVAHVCSLYAGVNVNEAPVKVFPAVHATLGGLWVDYEANDAGQIVRGSARNHATNIPGLYAVGDAAYQYDGAQRLPGNGLLAAAFGGALCSSAVVTYRAAMARSAFDLPRSIFERSEKVAMETYAKTLSANQDASNAENAYVIADELGEILLRDAFLEREDSALDKAAAAVDALAERAALVKVSDGATHMNQEAPFARNLSGRLLLARVLLKSARARAESRGAHFKPGAERDDARWLRSSIALVSEGGDVRLGDEIEYRCAGTPVKARSAIDTRLKTPGAREIAKPHATGKVAVGPAPKEPKEPKEGKGGKSREKDA